MRALLMIRFDLILPGCVQGASKKAKNEGEDLWKDRGRSWFSVYR